MGIIFLDKEIFDHRKNRDNKVSWLVIFFAVGTEQKSSMCWVNNIF